MGPMLWPVVLWVVVTGRSAAEWAKVSANPIAALRLGLDALCHTTAQTHELWAARLSVGRSDLLRRKVYR
jgi:hypothetical protein